MNSREKITYTLSQKKAFDLNRHISVTSGAGSGKTAVLVNRYLQILLEGDVRVREIVAITFTEKAAAELKNRIVEDVNELIEQGNIERDENRSLLDIREQLTAANIMTIHAFCAKILREFPVEAGVDAGFSVLQGIEARLALQDAIVETLKEIAFRPEDDSEKQELANLLRIVGRNALQTILGRLVDKRDIVDKLLTQLYVKPDEEVMQYWHNFIADDARKKIAAKCPIEDWVTNLERVLTIAKGKNAKPVAHLVDQLKRIENIEDQMRSVKEILPLILTKSGTIGKQNFLGRGAETSAVESAIEFLVNAAKEIGDTSPPNDDDKFLIDVSRQIFNLYRQALGRYELQKNLAGQLDFEDLQLKVKSLLENETIREHLAEKYKYIMVDEYQDTNQLQYDILKPLVSDLQTGNLFIVGDKKQSIYNFRGADVRVFEKTTSEITEQTTERDFVWEGETLEADEMERRGEIHLADNFRLLANLVGFVNLVFSRVMGGGSESEFHVEYEPLIKGRANGEPGSVELILLPNFGRTGMLTSFGSPPLAKEGRGDSHKTVNYKRAESLPVKEHPAGSFEESEEGIIARRIKKMIADATPIWKRDAETGGEVSHPIKYGDISILLRSRTNLPQIESVLEKHAIPYIVTGGIGFYQSQEIYDIYNHLQFLLTPQDDVALTGILRSPFFGLSDAQLYEISLVKVPDTSGVANTGSKDVGSKAELASFWDKLQRYATEQPDDKRVQKTVDLLNEHLKLADRMPLPSLIRRILNDTAAIGVLAYGGSGEQNLANYDKLLDIAREFEQADFSNLFDFMERLRILINEEQREGQAPTEASENAVQIMTIHAAKGLEFPVVILPYIDRGFKYDSQPYLDDALGLGFQPAHPERNYQQSEPAITTLMKARSGSKTEAEEKRIFYVATTRARDMLILSGRVSDKRLNPTWMSWLLEALDLAETPVEGGRENSQQVVRSSGEQEFPIRIITSAAEIELVEAVPELEPEVLEIPEIAIEELSDEPTGEIFSEEHFTTYAQCPAKYYLKYHLGVPETEVFNDEIGLLAQEESYDGTMTSLLDVIVHEVLKRIKTPTPKFETIEATIDSILARHEALDAADIRELRDETERHINNFLTSELAPRAFSSPENQSGCTIVAKFGDHFVTATIDRLFKNDAGEHEVIIYKTAPIGDVEHAASLFGGESARPNEYTIQMELDAMLVLKLFSEAQSVTTTIFFTHSGLAYSSRYDAEQLPEIERKLRQHIAQISSGKFEKNTNNCPDCPYAGDEVCIL